MQCLPYVLYSSMQIYWGSRVGVQLVVQTVVYHIFVRAETHSVMSASGLHCRPRHCVVKTVLQEGHRDSSAYSCSTVDWSYCNRSTYCAWELCVYCLASSRELRADGKRTLCCVHNHLGDLAGTAWESADWVHRSYSGLMLTGSTGRKLGWCWVGPSVLHWAVADWVLRTYSGLYWRAVLIQSGTTGFKDRALTQVVVLRSRLRGPCSMSEQSIWHLWQNKKRYWDKFSY
jgi:hypothetical protein